MTSDDGLVIGNFSAFPSEILEGDEVAYDEQFAEFIEQKKIEHQEIILASYPAPIAYYFERVLNNYDNANHRLQLLRSVWESLIYILYAAALSEIAHRRFNLSNIRVFGNQRIKNNNAGTLSDRLGYKMEFMLAVLGSDRTTNNELVFSEFITETIIHNLQELNRERNGIQHIAALEESQATNRFEELYPLVYDLLFDCHFLERLSLVVYKGSVDSPTNLKFKRFDGHSLMERNHNVSISTEKLVEIAPILNMDSLIFEFDDDYFCASPFICFIKEGQAERLKICYFKKTNNSTNTWTYEIVAGDAPETEIDPLSITYNINDNLVL